MALYMNGWADLDACTVVRSEEEEAHARELGFRTLSEPVYEAPTTPEKRKPGRPKKAAE